MDLTEAVDTKKRWQKYTEALYKEYQGELRKPSSVINAKK